MTSCCWVKTSSFSLSGVANDLWNNTFPTHMPKDGWPKPTFWLEGDTLPSKFRDGY